MSRLRNIDARLMKLRWLALKERQKNVIGNGSRRSMNRLREGMLKSDWRNYVKQRS